MPKINDWKEKFEKEFVDKEHSTWKFPIILEDIYIFISQVREQAIREVIDELESNPCPGKLVGEDISLQYWIEAKQSQLKSKFLKGE